jgi:ribosome-binding ATPase YchF (GTP1/OBG family)
LREEAEVGMDAMAEISRLRHNILHNSVESMNKNIVVAKKKVEAARKQITETSTAISGLRASTRTYSQTNTQWEALLSRLQQECFNKMNVLIASNV